MSSAPLDGAAFGSDENESEMAPESSCCCSGADWEELPGADEANAQIRFCDVLLLSS